MKTLALLLLFPLTALCQFTVPQRSGAIASSGGGGAPTLSYVQGCNNVSTTPATTVITCAMGSNVTSGNILIGISKAASSIVAVPTITSTSGTCSWSTIATSGNVASLYTAVAFYCQIPATEAETVQVSWASSLANFSDIAIAEYHSSSGWQSPALDVSQATAATTASTPCVTGSTATTAQTTELVTAMCEAYNSAQTWFDSVAPYINQTASSRNTLGWFSLTTTSAAAQSFSYAITADAYYGIIAAFKPN